MSDSEADDDAVAFFNRLSGKLTIKLTEEPERFTPKLANLVARPTSRVTSISLRMRVYENDEFRDLTEGEWSRVVLPTGRIRMRNSRVRDVVVEHTSRSGGTFTVRDLASAIEETERQARGSTEWLGGVDVHHVYFEGIELDETGTWSVSWGS
jgi:hypothetical protein